VLNKLGVVRFADLAGIQYVGSQGDSKLCVEAIRRLVQVGERTTSALLLSAERRHAFLIKFEREGSVVVKNGFSSGYRGTGPTSLADALSVLQAAQIDVEEVAITAEMMERLGVSALTNDDIDFIDAARPIRPSCWYDYVYAIYGAKEQGNSVWCRFAPVIPWGILDERLVDLALLFRYTPDKSIMDGFRRLEDQVRERTGLDEHGARLFSLAFAGDDSLLVWKKVAPMQATKQDLLDKGERAGRAQLFTGAYQAFRNPRAHRTPNDSEAEALAELLVLNQLFLLERSAEKRSVPTADDSPISR
jgi:uncharacterized protein (TIGR02391 family)